MKRFIKIVVDFICDILYTNYMEDKIKQKGDKKMTITKTHEGISISDVVENYLTKKLYIGYTLKEAKQMFREEFYNSEVK